MAAAGIHGTSFAWFLLFLPFSSTFPGLHMPALPCPALHHTTLQFFPPNSPLPLPCRPPLFPSLNPLHPISTHLIPCAPLFPPPPPPPSFSIPDILLSSPIEILFSNFPSFPSRKDLLRYLLMLYKQLLLLPFLWRLVVVFRKPGEGKEVILEFVDLNDIFLSLSDVFILFEKQP